MYEKILNELRRRNWMLGTAESCTGGLTAGKLTDIPGISEVFAGGIVAYQNEVKMQLLSVPEDILIRHGAVSIECAEAMAAGAAQALHCQCAVSTTGIAGPGGGTAAKPVGTVCFGFYIGGRIYSEKKHFSGDRAAVREQSVNFALQKLAELL